MSTLTIYAFGPGLGEPDLSPFCGKLLTWLRLAEIPYETGAFNPMKSPRGKAPYAVDGEQVISDSSEIIAHLTKSRGVSLDAGLSAEQRAQSRLLQSALEEHLYFILLYMRWQVDAVWATYREHIKASVKSSGAPGVVAAVVVGRIRKTVLKALAAQGTGRYPQERVLEQGLEVLDAIETTLASGGYLLGGDTPTSLDASGYAMLSAMLTPQLETPLGSAARGRFPNIEAYVKRMRERVWSDLE